MTNYRFVATTEQLQDWFDFGWCSEEGIIYQEELAGPDGMDYIIYPAEHHTKEDIEKTRHYFYTNRDVVHLWIGHPIGEYPIGRESEEWTPEQREDGFRKIVKDRQVGRVENCPRVDIYTASTVLMVLDNLRSENRKKYLERNAYAMCMMAWDILKDAKDIN